MQKRNRKKKIGERDFGNKNGEKELRYQSTESEIKKQ